MENVQFHVGEKTLRTMKNKMDWVIVDVPCSGSLLKLSGTGTIRRNPDLKWKFSDKVLENVIKTQRGILSLIIKRSLSKP
jgi:16S rRNA (cytosine967-C5)-methyltransferase